VILCLVQLLGPPSSNVPKEYHEELNGSWRSEGKGPINKEGSCRSLESEWNKRKAHGRCAVAKLFILGLRERSQCGIGIASANRVCQEIIIIFRGGYWTFYSPTSLFIYFGPTLLPMLLMAPQCDDVGSFAPSLCAKKRDL
jgi:hypothetical protein